MVDHVLEEMGNNSAHQISKSLEISSPNGLLGMSPVPEPGHGRRRGPRGGGPSLVNLRLLRFSRNLGSGSVEKEVPPGTIPQWPLPRTPLQPKFCGLENP